MIEMVLLHTLRCDACGAAYQPEPAAAPGTRGRQLRVMAYFEGWSRNDGDRCPRCLRRKSRGNDDHRARWLAAISCLEGRAQAITWPDLCSRVCERGCAPLGEWDRNGLLYVALLRESGRDGGRYELYELVPEPEWPAWWQARFGKHSPWRLNQDP